MHRIVLKVGSHVLTENGSVALDRLRALVEMIAARFGVEPDYNDFVELGIKTLKAEREFNKKAGLTNADDRLPEFMKYEPLPPHNVVWDFTGEELDSLWDFLEK